MGIFEKYKIAISIVLKRSQEDVFLFWKGRVALFTILKAMGIQSGDEIILSGFTCVVVPNAVKYLGAVPIYADINNDTLNPDYQYIANLFTPKTKAIIVQNTFGLSSDVDKISEFARSKGIYTIEDCTHGFGGTFNGRPNGSYCDAAFYSTQWNKPFSTGIGGFAVINNKDLLAATSSITSKLSKPSLADEMSLMFLNSTYRLALQPRLYWILRDLYRYLSKHGLVIGSSTNTELTAVEMPADYLKGISVIQSWLGWKRIKNINLKIAVRRDNAVKYSQFLAGLGKNHVDPRFFQNHSFLKYPLIVSERDVFMKKALKAHIPLGDWFLSPIHPVDCNFELWGINLEKIPVASHISRHIVNLPTEGADIKKVMRFLDSEKDLII